MVKVLAFTSQSWISTTLRVPRGSVVKCLTRNPGVLDSSLTGSSGFFRGSVLGQDTSEPSLVLVKPRKAWIMWIVTVIWLKYCLKRCKTPFNQSINQLPWQIMHLKTLSEKEKMWISIIFSFSHNVFVTSGKSHHFIYICLQTCLIFASLFFLWSYKARYEQLILFSQCYWLSVAVTKYSVLHVLTWAYLHFPQYF